MIIKVDLAETSSRDLNDAGTCEKIDVRLTRRCSWDVRGGGHVPTP
jgi:hypothetical protein